MTDEINNESNKVEKDSKKVRFLKFIRNIIIGFVVLLILIVAAGVAYTWYMGQNEVKDTPVVKPVKANQPTVVKPIQPGANAKESASVQMITSPIAPGSNASITVKTNPESICKIIVEYNKIASTDSGLVQKTADEYGIISWSWTVESTVPLGKWPVTVTCVWNKKSAVVIGDLEVKKLP